MHSLDTKINQVLDTLSVHAPTLLRISLGVLFVYFGWTSITTPDMWSSYVPEWATFMLSAETLVVLHGCVEILLGGLLIAHIYTRYVALVLAIDLLHIVSLLSFGPVWVRDVVLACSLLTLSLQSKNV